MTTLIIAEKSDVAKKLVAVLKGKASGPQATASYKGENFIITSAQGHLLELISPQEIKPDISWDSPASLLPIPRDLTLKPVTATKAKLTNIRDAAKHCNKILIATDADREGEYIGRTILDYLRWKGPTERLWLAGGQNDIGILKAFDDRRPITDKIGWARAGEARARSDWAYMPLVMCYSFFAQRDALGPNLGRGATQTERVTTVGRVQTPALTLVVEREREIQNFKPIDHFLIAGTFLPQQLALAASYSPVVNVAIIDAQPSGVTWEPSKRIPKDGEKPPLDKPLYTGKADVEAFKQRLMAAKDQSTVSSYVESTRYEQPPKTWTNQDAASALGPRFKISAETVQKTIEELYQAGWLSYPRTDEASLPMDFFTPEFLKERMGTLRHLPQVNKQAALVESIHAGKDAKVKPFVPTIFVKKDMPHYGLIPTEQVMTQEAYNRLSDVAQKVYLAVAQQFIQTLLPPAKYATQKVEFSVPVKDMLGHPSSRFSAKCQQLLEPGWRAAFNCTDKDPDAEPEGPPLKALKEKDAAPLRDISLTAKKTVCPPRFTDITLGNEMENVGRRIRDPKLREVMKSAKGLGTPATRKDSIKKLITRDYVGVQKGYLVPTPKAFDLVDYSDKNLTSPELTAVWEDFLAQICEQKDDAIASKMRDQFVNQQTNAVERIIRNMMETLKPGNRVSNGPGAGAGGDNKPTPAMVQAAKSIASRNGTTLNRGVLGSFEQTKAYLDEHMPKKDANGSYAPSSASVEYAKKLAELLPKNEKMPPAVLTDSKACSEFIEKMKKIEPPSEAQLELAKRRLAALPEAERVKKEKSVLTTKIACSKFLNSTSPSNSR